MAKTTCDIDSNCQSCGSADKCSAEEKERHAQQLIDGTMKNIHHTFMILSGKGGVGKSSVSVNLASTLAAQGSHHLFGLLRRHDPVLQALEEDHRSGKSPGGSDG